MKTIFLIIAYVISSISLSNASEVLKIKVDTRKIDIADLKIRGGISVLAQVCCVEDEYFKSVPTWEKSKPSLLILKIRMSLGSKIQIYDRKTGKEEVFSCKENGCFNNRILEVYQDTDLNKNIDKFLIRYYCGGNIRQSNVGGKGEDFIGILVLKGQVKVDNTSDKPIWCMDESIEPIWTVEKSQNKENGGSGLKRKGKTKKPEGSSERPEQVSSLDDGNSV